MVFRTKGFAGGMADEFSGQITAAVGVDFLAEPMEERLVITLIELVLKTGQVTVGGHPQLRSG